MAATLEKYFIVGLLGVLSYNGANKCPIYEISFQLFRINVVAGAPYGVRPTRPWSYLDFAK